MPKDANTEKFSSLWARACVAAERTQESRNRYVDLLRVVSIGAVVLGLVPAAASGLVIGGSLLLGVSWAAHTSNGVLNPAVALGIGSFSAAYIWGPILGAVIGTIVCAYLAKGKKEA